MKKKVLAGLLCTLVAGPALAGDPAASASSAGEPAGLGLGALIGGLIAGPPGAIIGAAGGLLAGSRSARKDDRMAELETRLALRDSEFAALQASFAAIGEQRAMDQQRVNLERRHTAVAQLADGVSVNVYFRTGSTVIGTDDAARLRQLAGFLNDFPEVHLQLDAHADRRGTNEHNRRLSEARADAVAAQLLRAGMGRERVRGNAYGESRAAAAATDADGLAFDRRVEIRLTLDSET